MDEATVKIISALGVSGLGWVAAWYLFQRLNLLQDKVMAAFIADTELKMQLKAAVDNLIAAVRESRK